MLAAVTSPSPAIMAGAWPPTMNSSAGRSCALLLQRAATLGEQAFTRARGRREKKQLVSLHACRERGLRPVPVSARCATVAALPDAPSGPDEHQQQRQQQHEAATTTAETIGVVQYDDRQGHPAMAMWRAYCALHGHLHLQIVPRVRPYRGPAQYRMFAVDWWAFAALVALLHEDRAAHVAAFLYTEADQWPVQPQRPLHPLFAMALPASDTAAALAVAEEAPCRDARGGGLFNMGTFLFRRAGGAFERLANATTASSWHGGSTRTRWPARQGAFSHDPAAYAAHKSAVRTLPPGALWGAPFAPVIGRAAWQEGPILAGGAPGFACVVAPSYTPRTIGRAALSSPCRPRPRRLDRGRVRRLEGACDARGAAAALRRRRARRRAAAPTAERAAPIARAARAVGRDEARAALAALCAVPAVDGRELRALPTHARRSRRRRRRRRRRSQPGPSPHVHGTPVLRPHGQCRALSDAAAAAGGGRARRLSRREALWHGGAARVQRDRISAVAPRAAPVVKRCK